MKRTKVHGTHEGAGFGTIMQKHIPDGYQLVPGTFGMVVVDDHTIRISARLSDGREHGHAPGHAHEHGNGNGHGHAPERRHGHGRTHGHDREHKHGHETHPARHASSHQ